MEFRKYFEVPQNATHRQYEALRAHFLEGLSTLDAAERFGYTHGSFKVMCSEFRAHPDRIFFVAPKTGPQAETRRDPLRELIVRLRKENLSVYDISRALEKDGNPYSPASVARVLQEEGFSRLPRRLDEERPGVRPEAADAADATELDLSPRRLRTQFGGLFLFMPFLAHIPLDKLLRDAGFPGTKQVPAAHAVRSLLALKLYGNARRTHVMGHVFDEGLALFAGLNTVPKRAFLTEYSHRVRPSVYPLFMRSWFDVTSELGLERGVSFDADFHTIPFHGDDPLMEKHYVSKRSRRQKGVLAFLVQDASKHVFCYANADLRKGEQNDEILCFVEFWHHRTGRYPEEVVFDSKLTTYANLNRLNELGINFITLRRRSKELLKMVQDAPASAWRRVELRGVSRQFRTPLVLDQRITLPGYNETLRQLVITDLGHEEPTFLITNQLQRSTGQLITRYAQRMLIENNIADGVDFFHLDALSSAVPIKTNLDLQLTLMGSSLYRLLGCRIGRGYEVAKARTIFNDFIQAAASITIDQKHVTVRFQKRAHNPLLMAAGFQDEEPRLPWLGGRHLRLVLG